MAIWRINNATVLGNYVCAQWVANTAYALGDRVVCTISYGVTTRRAYVYECTQAGTSHATTQPTWPTSGTVGDGTVIWTTRIPNDGNWDNASCILAYVLNHASPAAGDSIYIHNAHNEVVWSAASVYDILGSSTPSNPIKIVCVDKADGSLSTGAIISTSNAAGHIQFKRNGYSYGVNYKTTGGASVYIYTTGMHTFWILESNGGVVIEFDAGGIIVINTTPASAYLGCLIIINGGLDFGNSANYIYMQGTGVFEWFGGSIIAASGVSKLFDGATAGDIRVVKIRDVDLSGIGNGANARSIVDVVDVIGQIIDLERCKLSPDAGFTITTGAWPAPGGGRIRAHHCSFANKTYDFYEECYEGSIQDETTIVRSGGASDGVTPRSNKMVSSANTVDNIYALKSPPIHSWTNAITEKTFSIECLVDSATNLQNDEVWMEFEYPVDDSSGLGGFARDKCAMLGTPVDKGAGVGTGNWNTGAMSNPNSFKCAVTVTPGKAGPITARICLAKASTTIYYDPIITES